MVGKRIAFRADASVSIGTGHVMRCLTLARALRTRGAECTFVCRAHPGNMIEGLRREGFAVHELRRPGVTPGGPAREQEQPHATWVGALWSEDARETCEALQGEKQDWLVLDHYGLDARWERAVRRRVPRIMVIDDLADRPHDCELLLDPNFGRTAADYAELVPGHCDVLAGSNYVLLRPEFSAKRQVSLARRAVGRVRHLLVSMGGMDQHNATGEVLAALQRAVLPQGIRITAVLGPKSPALDDVRRQAVVMRWPTTVLVGVEDMAGLIAECDLAIGSGGTSTYERIYMGVPSILRPIAENQVASLQIMADAGLFEMYQSAEDLVLRVERAVVGGASTPPPAVRDGTADVSRKLLDASVWLASPRPFDVRRTFRWLQDDNLRTLFLLRHKPERRAHFRFWKSQLRNADQKVFSILDNGVHVGNAGLKNISQARGEAELWLYLGEAALRGKGTGRQALKRLEQIIRFRLNLPTAVLHVSAGNLAATHLYRSAGYSPVPADTQDVWTFGASDVIKMAKAL